jgi:hypothetical protein
MALADSTARKQAEEPAPLYRSAPHNIEAEQALLGAILVNNEAFYAFRIFSSLRTSSSLSIRRSISSRVT